MAASLRHHRIIIDAPDLRYISNGTGNLYWARLDNANTHDKSNIFSLTIDNDSMVIQQQSNAGSAFLRLTASNYVAKDSPPPVHVNHGPLGWCIILGVLNVPAATVNMWDKSKVLRNQLPLVRCCQSFSGLQITFQNENIRGFKAVQPGSIRGIKESVCYFLRSEEQRKEDSINEKENALAQVRREESDAEEKSRSIILQRQVNDALKGRLALRASSLENELRLLKGEKAATGASIKEETVMKMETVTEPKAWPFSFNGR